MCMGISNAFANACKRVQVTKPLMSYSHRRRACDAPSKQACHAKHKEGCRWSSTLDACLPKVIYDGVGVIRAHSPLTERYLREFKLLKQAKPSAAWQVQSWGEMVKQARAAKMGFKSVDVLPTFWAFINVAREALVMEWHTDSLKSAIDEETLVHKEDIKKTKGYWGGWEGKKSDIEIDSELSIRDKQATRNAIRDQFQREHAQKQFKHAARIRARLDKGEQKFTRIKDMSLGLDRPVMIRGKDETIEQFMERWNQADVEELQRQRIQFDQKTKEQLGPELERINKKVDDLQKRVDRERPETEQKERDHKVALQKIKDDAQAKMKAKWSTPSWEVAAHTYASLSMGDLAYSASQRLLQFFARRRLLRVSNNAIDIISACVRFLFSAGNTFLTVSREAGKDAPYTSPVFLVLVAMYLARELVQRSKALRNMTITQLLIHLMKAMTQRLRKGLRKLLRKGKGKSGKRT